MIVGKFVRSDGESIELELAEVLNIIAALYGRRNNDRENFQLARKLEEFYALVA